MKSQKEQTEFDVETLRQAVKVAKANYLAHEIVSILRGIVFAVSVGCAVVLSAIGFKILFTIIAIWNIAKLPAIVREQEKWKGVVKLAKKDLKIKEEGFQA